MNVQAQRSAALWSLFAIVDCKSVNPSSVFGSKTNQGFFSNEGTMPDFDLTKPPTASLVQGADQKQLTMQHPQQHQRKENEAHIVVDDALFKRTPGSDEEQVVSHGAEMNTQIGEDEAAPDRLYR
jgi:hypothetical protein